MGVAEWNGGIPKCERENANHEPTSTFTPVPTGLNAPSASTRQMPDSNANGDRRTARFHRLSNDARTGSER
jgi:hypothetical protein